MTDETYNGWSNRETWLFNVWYGDDLASEFDYWERKELCLSEYYEAKDKIGNNMFNDMLNINLVNWNELLSTYKLDW